MNDISLVGNAIQITRDNNSTKGYVNVPTEYDAYEEHENTYVSLLIGKDNFTWNITELTIDGDSIDDLADALTKLSTVFPNANSGNGGSGVESVTGNLVDNTDPANPIVSGSVFNTVTVDLDDDGIKGLPLLPFGLEIVPAPGNGKINVFHGALILTKYAASYSNIDANVSIWFPDPQIIDSHSCPLDGILGQQLFTQNGGSPYVYFTPAVSPLDIAHADAQGPVEQWQNTSIVLFVNNHGAGAFTDGDPSNKMRIKLWFTVEDIIV